jgi:succinyl-CoA synthetase beta subunit
MSSTLYKFASSAFLRRPLQLSKCAQRRHLNLLEYQSKGLLQDFDVTVQKFRVASTADEAKKIPQEFPCKEYVIKAQVLAGGRGKGTFDNGFKVQNESHNFTKITTLHRRFILNREAYI